METITESQVDLLAKNLPSIEQINQLCGLVNSSEARRLEFRSKLADTFNQTTSDALLRSGIALYILRDYPAAAGKLEKAKDCPEKFFYLAMAQKAVRQYDQALANLDKSIKAGTNASAAGLQKADILAKSGDFKAAEKELKACADDKNPDYLVQKGKILEAEGQYVQAAEVYKKAIEISPDHPEALFLLAYRCDLSGDEQAAIDYYRQIIANSPVYVNALLNIAVLYEDMGKFEKAAICVEKVLAAHPNHQRAQMFQKDIESSMNMYYDEDKERKKTRRNQMLETPISDFELSVRSRNCLRKMNINTVGDLLNISETELLSYKNFGETSLKEIKIILDSKSLRLGMSLDDKIFNPETVQNEEIEVTPGIMEKSIDELKLSIRAKKCLEKLNIHTLRNLTQKTEAELLGCKNFGVTSLSEIKKALSIVGLSLRKID
ncbi:MAG: DNA-directed RNA polymerase subunit alpha C-terminal domain-containing protein [Phycisphaerae bacterium]|nr:DNA-directed RNA polymerase subunit alpha C-terminal domain-containing protein [Phycisphaerae bacterium]